MRSHILKILLLAVCTVQLSAQGGLTATLDSSQLLIGARMHIALDLEETQEFEPLKTTMPGLDTLQPVELVKEPDWTFSQGSWKGDMEIAVFDTGFFLLPHIVLSGDKNGVALTYNSKRLALQVYGMPVDTSGVQPIKPIVEEPLNWQDFKFILVGIGVLLLIIMLIWLFKKLNSSAEESAPYIPPKEAHIVAMEKLEKLKSKALWQQGLVKEYYVELGDILREYLENRFEFPALEMTTPELSKAIKGIAELESFCEKATAFLSMADLVKFAKALPETDIHENWFDWVIKLILDTRTEEEDGEDIKENGS